MAEKQVIHSSDMPPPLGPYSHAVRVGDLLFIAGQPGVDANGVAPEAFEPQARLAFERLATILKAAGSGMEHVVKTTVFLTDAANFGPMNQLYAEFFPTEPPVRATPIVALPRGLLISIEAVAAVRS